MDKEEMILLINQAELHLRNLRMELNEVGHALDRIRRAF